MYFHMQAKWISQRPQIQMQTVYQYDVSHDSPQKGLEILAHQHLCPTSKDTNLLGEPLACCASEVSR